MTIDLKGASLLCQDAFVAGERASAGDGVVELAPFGGVKQSSMVREGPRYRIEDYVETKYLHIAGS